MWKWEVEREARDLCFVFTNPRVHELYTSVPAHARCLIITAGLEIRGRNKTTGAVALPAHVEPLLSVAPSWLPPCVPPPGVARPSH